MRRRPDPLGAGTDSQVDVLELGHVRRHLDAVAVHRHRRLGCALPRNALRRFAGMPATLDLRDEVGGRVRLDLT